MKSHSVTLTVRRFTFLALVCVGAVASQAATIVWTNTSGGSFGTAANWSPNSVPGGSDVAVITNAGTYTVTLNVSANVAGFILGGDSGTQTFQQNSQPFALSGEGEVRARGVFNLTGGTFSGVGTNVVTGIFNWSAGTISGGGTLQINSGGTLNITTAINHEIQGWRLWNAGTVNWSSGNVRGNASTLFYNAGLWNAQSDYELNSDWGPGAVFYNAGTYRKTAGAGTAIINANLVFTNAGTMEVQSGTLQFNGSGDNSGSFAVANGAGLNFNPIGKTFSFASGSVLAGPGLTRLVVGTHAMNGAITAENLELVGGNLAGNHILSGLLKWTGGDLNGVGSTTISSNGTLRILSGVNHDLQSRLLTNYGSVFWTDGAVRGNATTRIENYGLWEVQSDSRLVSDFAPGTVFQNTGTFRKSLSTGNTVVQNGLNFANTGAVEVQSGTLNFESGGSNSGSFSVANGSVVNFNSSGTTFSFAFGSVLAGPGLTRLVVGTHAMNGAITAENLELVGGNLAGNHVLSGLLKWTGGDLNGVGSTTISSNGTLRILSGVNHDLQNRLLTNYGSVLWTAGTVRGNASTRFYNYSLWEAQSDDQLNSDLGPGAVFHNAGTFRKSAGAGTTLILGNLSFNNPGTLDAQAGTLNLSGPRDLTGGTINIGISSLSSFGKVNLSGASGFAGSFSANLNGSYVPVAGNSFPVITYGSLGGNFGGLNLPFAAAWTANYGATTFSLTVLNSRPRPPIVADQIVNELNTLTVTNTATDLDVPANSLTYSLVSAPVGASISSDGIITWSPVEADGPATNIFTAVVTDNGSPPSSATNSFNVITKEVNVPPVLLLADTNIAELVTYSAQANATDADLPANALSFALVSGPDGLTVSPAGLISWTPAEDQGPSTNIVFLSVTDLNPAAVNATSLSATNSYTIVVQEFNIAPILPAQTNVPILELTTLTITNTATDPDQPTNALTYQLIDPPAGAVIDTNGVITWTPSEVQGPSTNTFTTVVTDFNPDAINTQQFSVTNNFLVFVSELNSAPGLTLPSNTNINEQVAFSANATATDTDQPTNTLSFALVSGPSGLTVSSNGVITWTPAENQGPSTNLVFISVTDTNPLAANMTSLSVTSSFQIIVREVNSGPTLGFDGIPYPDPLIPELQPYTFNLLAHDSDIPTNQLTYGVSGGPPGLTVSPSGLLSWTPSEAQGPGTYAFVVTVYDFNPDAVNAASFTNGFGVVIWVLESNAPPVLAALPGQLVNPGQVIGFTATATDADIPANGFSYSLLNPPAGADITPTGIFSWRPAVAQADTTNVIQVRVQDTGTPGLSDTNSFNVVVASLAPVVLEAQAFTNGQFTLKASGLVGLDYVLQATTEFSNWLNLSTNTPAAVPFELTDPGAGQFSNRFYRLRLQP